MDLCKELFDKKPLLNVTEIKKWTFAAASDQTFSLTGLVTGDGKLYLFYKNNEIEYLDKVSHYDRIEGEIAAISFDPDATFLLVITNNFKSHLTPLKYLTNDNTIRCFEKSFDQSEYHTIDYESRTGTITDCALYDDRTLTKHAIIGLSNGTILVQNLQTGSIVEQIRVEHEIVRLTVGVRGLTPTRLLLIDCRGGHQWQFLLDGDDNFEYETTPIETRQTANGEKSLKSKLEVWKSTGFIRCVNAFTKLIDIKVMSKYDRQKCNRDRRPYLLSCYRKRISYQRFSHTNYFLSLDPKQCDLVVSDKCLYFEYKLRNECCDIVKLSECFLFCANRETNEVFVLSRLLARLEGKAAASNDSHIITKFSFDDRILDINPIDDRHCYVLTQSSIQLIFVKCNIYKKLVDLMSTDPSNYIKIEQVTQIFELSTQVLLSMLFNRFIEDNDLTKAEQLFTHPNLQGNHIDLLLQLHKDNNLKVFRMLALKYCKLKKGRISIRNLKILNDLIFESSLSLYQLEVQRSRDREPIDKELRFLCEFLSKSKYCNVSVHLPAIVTNRIWPLIEILIGEKHCSLAIHKQFDDTYEPNEFHLRFLQNPVYLKQIIFVKCSASFLEFLQENIDNLPNDYVKQLVSQTLNPAQEIAKPLLTSYLKLTKKSRRPKSHLELYVNNFFKTYIQLYLVHSNELNWKSLNESADPNNDNRYKTVQKNVTIKRQVLSVHSNHTLLIDPSNNVYSWGCSRFGCLGNGPEQNNFAIFTPQRIELFSQFASNIEVFAVACGYWHSIVLTNLGIFAFGSNFYGQLGLGEIQESSYPQIIEYLPTNGDEIVVEVCCGHYHTLARTNTGQVYSWGWGVFGQLGHGSVEDCHYPKRIEYFNENRLTCVQIAAGHSHSLVLVETGHVYAFGSNYFGQLGVGQTPTKSSRPLKININHVSLISTSFFQSFVLTDTNDLYFWSFNPQELRWIQRTEDGNHHKYFKPRFFEYLIFDGNITEISIGLSHCAILTDKNRVYFWGRNAEGQIGDVSYGTDVIVPSLFTNNSQEFLCEKIRCGYDYTVAIDTASNVWICGLNSSGQLGLYEHDFDVESEQTKIFDEYNYTHKLLHKNGKTFVIKFTKLPQIKARDFEPIVETQQIVVPLPKVPSVPYKKLYGPNRIERAANAKHTTALGNDTFVKMLGAFFEFYDSKEILELFIEKKQYYAASKIALLQGNYAASFRFRVKTSNRHSHTFAREMDRIVRFYIRAVGNSRVSAAVLELFMEIIDFWNSRSGELLLNQLETIFDELKDVCNRYLIELLFCKGSCAAKNAQDLCNEQRRANTLLQIFSVEFCLELCKVILFDSDTKSTI